VTIAFALAAVIAMAAIAVSGRLPTRDPLPAPGPSLH
jgi:hypothetical protein